MSEPDLFTLAETRETAESGSDSRGVGTTAARKAKAPTPPHTCSRCTATWTGSRACRTFAGLALFDRHRHARGESGGCIDPAAIRNERTEEPVMFLRDGVWAGPEMTEEQKAAAFGTRS